MKLATRRENAVSSLSPSQVRLGWKPVEEGPPGHNQQHFVVSSIFWRPPGGWWFWSHWGEFGCQSQKRSKCLFCLCPWGWRKKPLKFSGSGRCWEAHPEPSGELQQGESDSVSWCRGAQFWVPVRVSGVGLGASLDVLFPISLVSVTVVGKWWDWRAGIVTPVPSDPDQADFLPLAKIPACQKSLRWWGRRGGGIWQGGTWKRSYRRGDLSGWGRGRRAGGRGGPHGSSRRGGGRWWGVRYVASGREASLGQGVGISCSEEWDGKSFFSYWPPAFDRKEFLSKGSLLFTGHSYSRN